MNDARLGLSQVLNKFVEADEDACSASSDTDGDDNRNDAAKPKLPRFVWMDGLLGVESPKSEAQLLDKKTVTAAKGAREADHVTNRKKMDSIRTVFIRSNLLNNSDGTINQELAEDVDNLLQVSCVHHISCVV